VLPVSVLPVVAGIGLGLTIGAVCRLFDIPVPAPHHVVGGIILIAMTLGFLVAGRFVGAS
jgi:XapX domain-containing protein